MLDNTKHMLTIEIMTNGKAACVCSNTNKTHIVSLPAPEDGHHITDDLVLLVHGQIGWFGSLWHKAQSGLI